MVVTKAPRKPASEGVAKMRLHKILMPVSKEQHNEESQEFLPLSSSGPSPFLSCSAPALSFTDPILRLDMGYSSDIQTSEEDALVDRQGWCSGENRIPGRFK